MAEEEKRERPPNPKGNLISIDSTPIPDQSLLTTSLYGLLFPPSYQIPRHKFVEIETPYNRFPERLGFYMENFALKWLELRRETTKYDFTGIISPGILFMISLAKLVNEDIYNFMKADLDIGQLPPAELCIVGIINPTTILAQWPEGLGPANLNIDYLKLFNQTLLEEADYYKSIIPQVEILNQANDPNFTSYNFIAKTRYLVAQKLNPSLPTIPENQLPLL